MRSILVHVCNDAGIEGRLQIALDLARSFDAHLTFLQAVTQPVTLPGDFYGNLAAAMMPVVKEQADELRRFIEDRLKSEDVCWNWIQEIGMDDNKLINHAALNDLVLVGAVAPLGSETQPSRLAGALAIHGRTPVMVTPQDAKGIDVTKPAVIAWNGSAQASHALRSSLELLRSAAAVYMVTITGENDESAFDLPPSDGAEYLSRHGIGCEIIELPAHGCNPAELIMAEAQSRGAGYVVLGAYGHARLFELVFGGVTRKILKNPPLPLFLAH